VGGKCAGVNWSFTKKGYKIQLSCVPVFPNHLSTFGTVVGQTRIF